LPSPCTSCRFRADLRGSPCGLPPIWCAERLVAEQVERVGEPVRTGRCPPRRPSSRRSRSGRSARAAVYGRHHRHDMMIPRRDQQQQKISLRRRHARHPEADRVRGCDAVESTDAAGQRTLPQPAAAVRSRRNHVDAPEPCTTSSRTGRASCADCRPCAHAITRHPPRRPLGFTRESK
jgi:hypothetical protein